MSARYVAFLGQLSMSMQLWWGCGREFGGADTCERWREGWWPAAGHFLAEAEVGDVGDVGAE